ncbi:MAG: Holliday junction resolvase RuvX [Dehalococcoidia bacterium]|nr:Holliday junction resolvase RuvX [Dehalococcoidia bacterium]
MRWVGVDPGTQRVGIAVCDPEERVAVPVEVVPTSAAVPAVRTVATREEAGGVVVGLPLLLDGSEGEAARLARRLGERIRRRLDLPVEYEDERFTTVEAEREGSGGEPRDDVAAALILQQFIDRRRTEGPDARA